MRAYARWAPVYDHLFGVFNCRLPRRGRACSINCRRAASSSSASAPASRCRSTSAATASSASTSAPTCSSARERRVERKKLGNVEALHEMDAGHLAFADESFDAAAAMFVITVVPEPAARPCRDHRASSGRAGGWSSSAISARRPASSRAVERWLPASRRRSAGARGSRSSAILGRPELRWSSAGASGPRASTRCSSSSACDAGVGWAKRGCPPLTPAVGTLRFARPVHRRANRLPADRRGGSAPRAAVVTRGRSGRAVAGRAHDDVGAVVEMEIDEARFAEMLDCVDRPRGKGQARAARLRSCARDGSRASRAIAGLGGAGRDGDRRLAAVIGRDGRCRRVDVENVALTRFMRGRTDEAGDEEVGRPVVERRAARRSARCCPG